MVALGNGSDQVPLVLLSRFAMRRVAVCNQSLNRSTACSAPSKARNSQPCEDSDAPNCEVYDSVLTHVLGQVDRNILFCAPACTESAISMSIRCSYSQPPRQPRSASALFALALHSGFPFLLCCCCLRSHAVEFVLGPEYSWLRQESNATFE